MNQYTPLIERFEAAYTPEPNSGCWLWHGAAGVVNKYGDIRPHMRVKGKVQRAYRVAYQLFVGPIPDGLLVRHTCDTSLCVNPRHLLCGTMADNAHDAIRRGRATFQKYPNLGRENGLKMKGKISCNKGRFINSGQLTRADKEAIINRLIRGDRLAHIARDYGITYQAVAGYRARAVLAKVEKGE